MYFINEFQASIIRQLYTDVWFIVPSRQGRLFEKKPYSQKLPSNSWRETNRTFHFLLLSELKDYLNITNLCIHLERVHNLTRFFCSLLYAIVALSKLILYCII